MWCSGDGTCVRASVYNMCVCVWVGNNNNNNDFISIALFHAKHAQLR